MEISALAATAVTKAQYELRAEFKAGTSGDAIKREIAFESMTS
jgi:hypothetical protein